MVHRWWRAKISPAILIPKMTKSPATRRNLIYSLYAAVLLLELFFLFYRLDGRLLWGDEAETAVLAKNVVSFGVPKTEDGVNHITLYGGNIDGNRNNIWIWSPWLQEYLAAGAFKLLGPTTWAARAPFAFIGWLSLILLALTVHKIYRDHWTTLAAMALLGTSEIFLLHARQCRYYSISVFGEILFVYAIYQLLGRNRWGAGTLAVALLLQFYSNYIVSVANLPILVPLTLVLYQHDKRLVLWLALGLGAALVAVMPWLFYAHPWRQLGIMQNHVELLEKIGSLLRDFHFYFLPWVFVALPVGGWLTARISAKRRGRCATGESIKKNKPAVPGDAAVNLERFLCGLLPLYFLVIVILPGVYPRYLLPLLPICCLLVAVWVLRHVPWRTLAVAILLLQCTSNGFALASDFTNRGQNVFRWPIIEFVEGISRPYRDRFADVLEFLNGEARPGQTVFGFDPEFPLIFYTRLKIVDGRLSRGNLPGPLPDWILSESASGVSDKTIVPPASLIVYYEPVVISVHNSRRNGCIPLPNIYEYTTARTYSPFLLYKKKNASPPD